MEIKDRDGRRWERPELWRTKIDPNFPIYAGCCNGVTYDSQSDRYVAMFRRDSLAFTLKPTVPVAKFLLMNMPLRDKEGCDLHPTVYLHMDDNGACDDVRLVAE